MGEVHPSILNRLRREQQMKNGQGRNIIPAQREPETETPKEEAAAPSPGALGRLAMRLNLMGEPGET